MRPLTSSSVGLFLRPLIVIFLSVFLGSMKVGFSQRVSLARRFMVSYKIVASFLGERLLSSSFSSIYIDRLYFLPDEFNNTLLGDILNWP